MTEQTADGLCDFLLSEGFIEQAEAFAQYSKKYSACFVTVSTLVFLFLCVEILCVNRGVKGCLHPSLVKLGLVAAHPPAQSR